MPWETIAIVEYVKKLICKNMGHTVSFFDSGYEVCDRCGSHAYYNENEWCMEWHTIVYWLIVRLWNLQEDFNRWQAKRRDRKQFNDDFPF